MKFKKCYYCQNNKPHTDFYKNKTRSDGLQSHCKICHKKRKRQHYEENKEVYLDNDRVWSTHNRDKRRKISKTYRDTRNPTINAGNARYRAKKLKATPPWLTEQHHDLIREVYSHARDCEMVSGEKYHVDHIIPLQGKYICGLHVPWNLQVLPADINLRKSGKLNV